MSSEDRFSQMFGPLAGAQVPVPAMAVVLARGRQRRRHARMIATAAVTAAVVAATAAVQLPSVLRPGPQVRGSRHGALCRASEAVGGLRAMLTTPVPASDRYSLTPLGYAAATSTAYVQMRSAAYTGIAAIDPWTGAIRSPIQRTTYGNRVVGQFAGHFLVWATARATSGYQPVRSWSATTGGSRTLRPPGAAGFVGSAPVISITGTFAAWQEQLAGRRAEIVEANLSTGKSVVIATGYVGAPVFYGHVLVWQQRARSGGPGRLAARHADTFPATQAAGVPVGLTHAGDASVIVAYGGAAAYLSPDRRTLYYSARPGQRARPVTRFPLAYWLAPAVGLGYLALGAPGALISTGSHADLAGQWQQAVGTGTFVWLGSPTLSSQPWWLVRGALIATLRCAAKS
jgi:hypothetical protein